MNAPDPKPCADANPAPAALADHSRFVQRVRRRYDPLLHRLPPGLPDFAAVAGLVANLEADGTPVMSALRIARQLVLERLDRKSVV